MTIITKIITKTKNNNNENKDILDESKDINNNKDDKEEKEEQLSGSNRGPPEKIEIWDKIPQLSSDSKYFLAKIPPHLFAIDPNPFSETNYQELSDSSLIRRTIHWKTIFDGEGGISRESNARIVKWSDGSTQLLIGNEAFEVSEQNISKESNYLFVKQKEALKSEMKLQNKNDFSSI